MYIQVVTDYRLPEKSDVSYSDFYISNVDTQYVHFVNIDSSIRYYDPYYSTDTTEIDTSSILEAYVNDTVFQKQDYLCNTLINGYENYVSWGEFDFHQNYYGKGLGKVYSKTHYAEDGSGYTYRTLDYFKKDDNTCGEKYITAVSLDHEFKDFSIYPNPVYENINFDIGSIYDKILVSIMDQQGKVVYSSWITPSNQSLDLTDLSSGIYFVRFIIDDKLAIKKIIKQ